MLSTFSIILQKNYIHQSPSYLRKNYPLSIITLSFINNESDSIGEFADIGRYGNVKKNSEFAEKKDLYLQRSFSGLINQVFPCFHCLIKPLLHTCISYAIYFFSVDGANGMLLNCHMCQLHIAVYLSLKNTFIYREGCFYQKLVLRVFYNYSLVAKGINYLKY